MIDAREFAGLATTNMTWNMVVGLLHNSVDPRQTSPLPHCRFPSTGVVHMFRPVLPLAAALALVLAACSTTEPASSASTDTGMAADTSTSATASTDATTGATGGISSSTDASGATSSSSTGTTNSATSNCNADAARSVVGQTASADVIDQARTAAGAETARTLSPGQATTMEFNGSRLNLDVDASNKITNVRCG